MKTTAPKNASPAAPPTLSIDWGDLDEPTQDFLTASAKGRAVEDVITEILTAAVRRVGPVAGAAGAPVSATQAP